MLWAGQPASVAACARVQSTHYSTLARPLVSSAAPALPARAGSRPAPNGLQLAVDLLEVHAAQAPRARPAPRRGQPHERLRRHHGRRRLVPLRGRRGARPARGRPRRAAAARAQPGGPRARRRPGAGCSVASRERPGVLEPERVQERARRGRAARAPVPVHGQRERDVHVADILSARPPSSGPPPSVECTSLVSGRPVLLLLPRAGRARTRAQGPVSMRGQGCELQLRLHPAERRKWTARAPRSRCSSQPLAVWSAASALSSGA